MSKPKSEEVSDLLDPDWMKDDNADLGTKVPKLTKPDPAETSKAVSDLLTPTELEDHPDPLAGTLGELIPDALRGGDEEDEFKTAKAKTPIEKASDDKQGITLGEWVAKHERQEAEKAKNEELEREIESRKIEDENEEIKESFRRVTAKMKGDDLTPDHYKDQE